MTEDQNPDFARQIMQLVSGGEPVPLRDEDVFIKTRLGRIEASSTDSTLPRRLRMLLILVDGHRTLADFRRGLTRFRNLDECFDMLRKMGYIETLPIKLDF